MSESESKVHKLLRQQSVIADFGSFALHQGDLLTILTEAAKVCAAGMNVSYSKVCRYRPEQNDLLIEAGYGWRDGVIGNVVSRADETSPQGRAFITGKPSICNDLGRDKDFELPAFYAAHNIVSTIDVIIKGADRPWGVLEIDSDHQHDYDQHDIDFLTAFANVLAEAVVTSTRTASLHEALERMTALMEEKDKLLDQKKVLAEELQHRVRNNLQLVHGMLSKQLEDTADKAGQRGIRAIARRVSTLARVYDHLLGNEMTRTTDLGSYVKSLCLNLTEIQAVSNGGITLTCDSQPLLLDLDVVTVLGLIVAELVTNSYEHAFPGGVGKITVSVSAVDEASMAIMTIRDNGTGFKAEAESKRHGVGLVRRLIEQIRGIVEVESSHGTVWTIKFPVAPAVVDTAAQKAA